MTNSMTEIPLSKAPGNFFDQDEWAEYVAHFDTEDRAHAPEQPTWHRFFLVEGPDEAG
jgi:hypothetical protein